MAINHFEAPPSPIDAISKALTIASQVYGMKHADDAHQKLLGEMAEQKLKTAALQRQGDLDTQSADPSSDISKLAVQSALNDLAVQARYKVVTPESQSSIAKLLQGAPAQAAIPATGKAFSDGSGPVVENLPEIAAQDAKAPLSASQVANLPGAKERLTLMSDLIKDKGQTERTAQMMAGLNARTAMSGERLGQTQNKDAGQVGKEYENNHLIATSKNNLNSLTRSQSILSNPDKPVLAKDLNLAYNDYINAVAAGGAATEGKIHRELPENWEVGWNDLKTKAGQFDDLRQNPTGQKLIQMLGQNIGAVRNDLQSAVSDQAYDIFQNNASSTNPKAVEVNKSKLKAYAPGKHAELFGGEAGSPTFISGLNKPAQEKPASGGLIPEAGAAGPTSKSINGVPYVKVQGGWKKATP